MLSQETHEPIRALEFLVCGPSIVGQSFVQGPLFIPSTVSPTDPIHSI